MLQEGEKLERLGGDLIVITDAEHTFGHDAILLASFAAPRAGENACDFGTGCGIIPLLWCRSGCSFHIDAVEIQPDAALLAERSVALCGLQDSVTVICGDYLTCERLRAASYDRVVCNPPYRRLGSGAESKSEAARIARSEQCAALGGMLSRAAKILKNGGCLSLCLRPERLAECLALMRSCGIEPKRLRMVQQRAQTRPWLVLVEGKRGAHTGLDVEPVLLLEQGGGISQEMRRIYQGVRADTAVAPELLNRNFQ